MTERLAEWKKLSRKLQRADSALAPLIRKVGPPVVRFRRDPFRTLSSSILSQQLATAAARAITSRFAALAPPFPRPEHLAQWPVEKLRGAGVSSQKARYLAALAAKWTEKGWRNGWTKLSNEELVARLTEVTGIGTWTAQMFLIFSYGRTDVLPVDDYGIRKGLQLLYQLDEMPKPQKVPELVPHWKGMESVACWYVWRGLDQKLFILPESES